jgi:hypothetical protein
MSESRFSESAPTPGPFRWSVAGVLFVAGLCAPAAIPVLRQLDLPGPAFAVLSAGLVFGIPEVLWMLAVAVLGKAGFEQGTRWFFGLLRRHAPPERVSRRRYRLGLVMFALPLLTAWLGPYVALAWPGVLPSGLPLLVAGDLLFGLSFFVLGGEFWDKVRALFVHGAAARFPQAS